MFSTQSKTKIIVLATFILLSATAFNLDQAKILSFGKELSRQIIVIWYRVKMAGKNHSSPLQTNKFFLSCLYITVCGVDDSVRCKPAILVSACSIEHNVGFLHTVFVDRHLNLLMYK